MDKTRFIILALALASGTAYIQAQNTGASDGPMTVFTDGVKTYYPDKMGYAPNTNLNEVLNGIQENYSNKYLMVNGKTYNQGMSYFLSQTTVDDVECIQIITNTGLCGSTIGEMGNINIVLKKKDDGTHGRVTYSIDTRANMYPAANISYKKDALTVWGSALGYIDKSKTTTATDFTNVYYSQSKNSSNKYVGTTDANTNQKRRKVAATFGLEYRKEKDVFTLNLAEQWGRTKEDDSTDKKYTSPGYRYTDNRDYSSTYINNNFFASADYVHTFSKVCSLSATLSENMSNGPQWLKSEQSYYRYNLSNPDSDPKTSNSGVATSYTNHANKTLLDVHVDLTPCKNIMISAGVIGGISHGHITGPDASYASIYETWNGSKINPFINASFLLKKWTLGFDVNASRGKYDVKPESESNNGKGRLSLNNTRIGGYALWKPNKHNGLMFGMHSYRVVDTLRNFNIESNGNNSNRYFYLSGINKFTNTRFYTFDLGYTYTGKNVSAGADVTFYHHDFDITYQTYDQIHAHVSAFASAHIGRVNINGSVNVYTTDQYGEVGVEGFSDDYDDSNWNIILTPVVSLPKDFKISATAIYYGKETYNDYEYDPHFWLSFRASKEWKHFEAFIKWENIIGTKINGVYSPESTSSCSHYSTFTKRNHDNNVTFGGCWKF